jgi:hypothetical protein
MSDFDDAHQTAFANAIASTLGSDVSAEQVVITASLSQRRALRSDSRRLATLQIAYIVTGLSAEAATSASTVMTTTTPFAFAGALSDALAGEGLPEYTGVVSSISADVVSGAEGAKSASEWTAAAGSFGASCGNGVLDILSESDIDCGGACPKCAKGYSCFRDADCSSGDCFMVSTDAGVCTNAIDALESTTALSANGYDDRNDAGVHDALMSVPKLMNLTPNMDSEQLLSVLTALASYSSMNGMGIEGIADDFAPADFAQDSFSDSYGASYWAHKGVGESEAPSAHAAAAAADDAGVAVAHAATANDAGVPVAHAATANDAGVPVAHAATANDAGVPVAHAATADDAGAAGAPTAHAATAGYGSPGGDEPVAVTKGGLLATMPPWFPFAVMGGLFALVMCMCCIACSYSRRNFNPQQGDMIASPKTKAVSGHSRSKSEAGAGSMFPSMRKGTPRSNEPLREDKSFALSNVDGDGFGSPASPPPRVGTEMKAAASGSTWSEYVDEKGRPYYFNHDSNTTQWSRPTGWGEGGWSSPKGQTSGAFY